MTLAQGAHYAEAEKLWTQTLEIEQRVHGPDHPSTLVTMDNLGAIFMQDGRNADAEKLFRQVVDSQRRVLGPEHPNTLRSMGDVAEVLIA